MAADISVTIFRGSCKDLYFPIYGSDGSLEDISGWDDLVFNVKRTNDSGVLIHKTVGDGITLDYPSAGYARVRLVAADTTLDVSGYRCTLARTESGSEDAVADGTFKIRGNTVLPA